MKYVLGHAQTPARVSKEGHATIYGHLATGDGLGTLLSISPLLPQFSIISGTLFIHPHPGDPQQVLAFVLAEDEHALERVLRLFPLRTGVSVPAWVITSKEADQFAAAGVVGAG